MLGRSNWDNKLWRLMGMLFQNVNAIHYACVKHVGLYPSWLK